MCWAVSCSWLCVCVCVQQPREKWWIKYAEQHVHITMCLLQCLYPGSLNSPALLHSHAVGECWWGSRRCQPGPDPRFSITCTPRSIRSWSSSCWQRNTAACSRCVAVSSDPGSAVPPLLGFGRLWAPQLHTNNNWQHPEQTLYAGERWLQMPLRCVPLPCIGTTDHELPQRGITLFWKKSWRKKHIKFFCWRYQIEYINQHFALLTCSGLYPVSSEPHCSARVGGPVVTLTPVVAARPWSSWWWPLSKVQIPSKKIIIIKNEMINTNE